tara:strand:+ start:335 stop:721 length:387 start_codon:yes stop_codon:yes gene_type:complete
MELMAMLGGGLAGFIFKLIGTLVQAQQANMQAMITKQEAADTSADKAAARDGGTWVRRLIVCACLFAVVIVPLIMAFSENGMTVSSEKGFWIFKKEVWTELSGFVLISELKITLLSIISFYFGSSQIK